MNSDRKEIMSSISIWLNRKFNFMKTTHFNHDLYMLTENETLTLEVYVYVDVMVAVGNQFFERTTEKKKRRVKSPFFFLFFMYFSCRHRSLCAFSRIRWEQQKILTITSLSLLSFFFSSFSFSGQTARVYI